MRFRDIFKNPESGPGGPSPLPETFAAFLDRTDRLFSDPPGPEGSDQKSGKSPIFGRGSSTMAGGRGEGSGFGFWGKVKMSRKRTFPIF